MVEAFEILGHAFLGVLAGFLFLWAFVELLNLNENNLKRAQWTTTLASISGYLGLILGLSYYLNDYGEPGGDRDTIKGGDWDWAHGFFMETKEHFAIMGFFLMVVILLLIWRTDLVGNPKAKKMTIWLLGALVLGVLILEGYGAIIAFGLRIGLGGT